MTSSSTQDLTILGNTDHHSHSHPFGITQTDRLGHLWILGKTGTGKSTPLTRLSAADLQAHQGLMVIDPHGDLVESIPDFVRPCRVVDTIYSP
jgi:type IV secretory pathway VirB4 component